MHAVGPSVAAAVLVAALAGCGDRGCDETTAWSAVPAPPRESAAVFDARIASILRSVVDLTSAAAPICVPDFRAASDDADAYETLIAAYLERTGVPEDAKVIAMMIGQRMSLDAYVRLCRRVLRGYATGSIPPRVAELAVFPFAEWCDLLQRNHRRGPVRALLQDAIAAEPQWRQLGDKVLSGEMWEETQRDRANGANVWTCKDR